jgi:uncharacterized protein YfaP (DUF2135 family)
MHTLTHFRLAAWAALATVCAALTACGGSDSPTPTVVTATADTLTLDIGQTGQLLANDRLGSAAAVAGTSGNVVFTLTSGSLPAGYTVTDGSVTIGAAAVPGVTVLNYRICESASTSNCATTTAQVTVPTPPIVATADTFNLASGSSGDVLANDTLGGTPATAARVIVNATGTLPTGVTLSAAGLVSVGTTAVAGTYAVGYRICQTVAPTNCANATATVTVLALGAISGRAVDSATAVGIASVRVSAAGLTTTTDATGAFTLTGVPSGTRVPVVFTTDTHAETARLATVSAAATSDVQVRLVRVQATVDVPVAAGGTATVAGTPAQVVLPASAVERADGSVPSGNLKVRLTPINPASDSSVMPGDFTTLVSGSASPIESFGAMNVVLTDATGAALKLRSGVSATVRIPVATRNSTPPASIPLFHFDTATARWVQEGTATLGGTAPNQYYEGTVTHFSTWNADQVYNTVKVTGCVADALGVRVAGALVQSDGISYSGIASTTSNSAGTFSIAIRKDSVATIVGLSGGLLSNTLRVGPYSVDTDITGSGCLGLGAAGAGVTMKLTWGLNPSDLDSHLWTPNGTHVYFSNQGSLLSAPFANLDVDDTSSFGPEVVTLTKLMVGTYKYAIYNYSGQSSGLFSAATARVELSVPGRAVELFTPPTTGETTSTNWWLLFEFDVDASCNITLRRTGSFTATSPVPTIAPTVTYCTRP